MAQTVVLALDDTAATSAAVTATEGTTLNLAIYTDDAGGIPSNEGVLVLLDTPSQDQVLATLSAANPGVSIPGPVEVILKRAAGGVAKGVVRYA